MELTSRGGTCGSWAYRNVAEEVHPLGSEFADWQMSAMLGPGSGFFRSYLVWITKGVVRDPNTPFMFRMLSHFNGRMEMEQ